MSKKKVTITEPPTKQSVAEVAIPNGFKHTQFEECLYSASQSHKDGVDLWLFQLPEEVGSQFNSSSLSALFIFVSETSPNITILTPFLSVLL